MSVDNLSRNQVRKLGEKLKEEGINASSELLINLQAYRETFKEPLAEIFKVLHGTSANIDIDNIVTYRIKRIDSIIRKLERYPNMKLDTMGDIAGCRCIVKDEKVKRKLIADLGEKIHCKSFDDYTLTPQPSGYKSYHINGSINMSSKKNIEIQIRTINEHNWATLVEIVDLLYDKKIKEGEKCPELERFHFLLSDLSKIGLSEMREIIQITKSYDIYDTLRKRFFKNYIEVRQQWSQLGHNQKNKFYVIEATRSEPPKISSFKGFVEAEEEYYKRFLNNKNANIVLTRISNADYHMIERAYSNYILTMHSFIDDYLKILEDMTIDTIKLKKAKAFYSYYNMYLKAIYNLSEDSKSENEAIKTLQRNNAGRIKELSKWNRDIYSRYNKKGKEIIEFLKKWSNIYPRSGFVKVKFDFALWLLKRKYS